MRDRADVKKLYDQANTDLAEARKLQDPYKTNGQEIPVEVEAKITELLDSVEDTDRKAKALENRWALEDRLNAATAPLAPATVQMPGPVKVSYGGRDLTEWEIKRYMAITPFKTFMPVHDVSEYEDYKSAMTHYMLDGPKSLGLDEMKALSAGIGPEGGYLVQDTFINQLIVKSREVSAMRRISTVLPPVPSGSVIIPSEDNMLEDAEWTTELATTAVPDAIQPFGRIRMTPKPFAKRIYVSRTLMRTPTFDVDGYVRDRFAYKFGITEEEGFINGEGGLEPVGLLNTPGLPVVTTATANVVTSDDVINWIYSLPAAYANLPSTKILSNRSFIRKIRLMVDGGGNYVWQPGLQIGTPGRILDVAYEFSDKFDDALDVNDAYENNGIAAVIGAFEYFWIVDAIQLEIQVLVEIRAQWNQIEYIGRKEADGMVVLPEAFMGLKVKST